MPWTVGHHPATLAEGSCEGAQEGARTDVHELAVEGVSKAYGRTAALRDVTATFGSGVTAILGPNGAGKTTLLRILATALVPDCGRVVLGGQDIFARDALRGYRANLGYVPQSGGYYPQLRVHDYLEYVALLKGASHAESRALVAGAMEALGIAHLERRRIRQLSGGLQRRVVLAQALLGDPGVLLLDEPAGSLDPEQRRILREAVAAAGERAVVVLSTHQTDDVTTTCGRVIVLLQGAVAFTGTPDGLASLAQGYVGLAVRPPDGSISQVRLPDGRYRVLTGERIEAGAGPIEPVPPSIEDGYFMLAARRW